MATTFPNQLVLLPNCPEESELDPVINRARYTVGTEVRQWMDQNYYGNKPTGGLWSSTYTPQHAAPSAWFAAIKTHPLVKAAAEQSETLYPKWLLTANPAARICEIRTLADALYFQRIFRIHPELPLPPAALEGPSAFLTTCQTNWEQAAQQFDGIHLTHEAADEIETAHFAHGIQTPFDTWHCESTLWLRWVFDSVSRL